MRTKFSRLWRLKDYYLDEYDNKEAVLRPIINEHAENGGYPAGSFFINKIKLPKLVQELMRSEYERGKNEIKSGLYKLLK